MKPQAHDPGIRDALAAVREAMRAGDPGPDAMPDHGFDPRFVARTAPLLDFFYRTYFRVRLRGVENIPEGAALVVANHSGGLPYDGAILVHAISREHPTHRRLRPLVATFAVRSPWMRHVVARYGCVLASLDNGLELLGRGELCGVFPEGLRGVGKLFRERYRLRNFGRGGFVRLARRARVPIVPVAIVGAEEIHPVIGKITTLAGPLGIPYIPVTPTFPLLGPLGLLPVPTKWTIDIGAPIPVPPEGEQGGPELTAQIAERVRAAIDDMIANVLVHRRSILFG